MKRLPCVWIVQRRAVVSISIRQLAKGAATTAGKSSRIHDYLPRENGSGKRGVKARLLVIGLVAARFATAMEAYAAASRGKVCFDLNSNIHSEAKSEYGLPQWTVRLDVVPAAAFTLRHRPNPPMS